MANTIDRHEQFRQIRSSVRGSEKFLLVGIDVAKNDHHAFFGTPNGKTLRKNLVFDNSIKCFENLRSLVSDIRSKHGLDEVVYLVHDAARWEAKSLVSQLKSIRETVKGNEQLLRVFGKRFELGFV